MEHVTKQLTGLDSLKQCHKKTKKTGKTVLD